MIVILLFIVLFFVLLEIENLHWNLIESQSYIRRLSNRIYELQGAIRVLTLQKAEKLRVKTMWISTNRDSSEREVQIEEESEEKSEEQDEEEQDEEEQEDEVEVEED